VDAKKGCPCRKLDAKENLGRWRKMLDAKGFGEGEAVLRFRSSMAHKNPAMRDFPLARINLAPHARQGTKYRVWPLMNLAVTVDDIDEKMTHIIRAKDHRDNAKRQEMIYKVLGKKFPWTAFLGRYRFTDMELSTTKMRQAIERGDYSGWDDKRLPTLASLRKQGYKPQAFWKFAEQVGLSESDKVMDRKEYFALLDAFNKKASQ
jgi:glutamyl-tRNA synthetase